MATNFSKRNITHEDCGGEIEQTALKYEMGVLVKCKKCGRSKTKITRNF